MVKHNREQYSLTLTRYSSNAFFRRQLGERLPRRTFHRRAITRSRKGSMACDGVGSRSDLAW